MIDGADPTFRLGYVPGVTPTKWVRTWNERHIETALVLVPLTAAAAEAELLAGNVHAAVLRPPVDRTAMSAIALYEEVPVLAFSVDHELAATAEDEHVDAAALAAEVVLLPLDDVLAWADAPGIPAAERPADTAAAFELVGAGVGVLAVPHSLARLHHRKDVTFRLLDGGPSCPVVLAWVTDATSDAIQDFVGIVRGRTARSSRGRGGEPATDGKQKATAKAKAEARAARERKAAQSGAKSGQKQTAKGAARARRAASQGRKPRGR